MTETINNGNLQGVQGKVVHELLFRSASHELSQGLRLLLFLEESLVNNGPRSHFTTSVTPCRNTFVTHGG